MSVSVPSMTRQQKFLVDFKRDVDLPLTNHAEVKEWFVNVKNILKKSVLPHPTTPLSIKALDLQERFKWPVLDKTNIYAIEKLTQEMQTALKDKAKQLGSMLAFQSMLSSIVSPYQMESFLSSIRSTCRSYMEEGTSPHKAFEKALAYAVSRSLIQNSDLEEEEALQRYRCVIQKDLVDSQPAYLRVDSQGSPREVYHETDLLSYLVTQSRDPITREKKTAKDILKAPREQEKVRDLISSFKYPRLSSCDALLIQDPISLSSLASVPVLLAARIGYSLMKEVYEESRKTKDYNEAALEAEKVQALAIDLFEPFLQEASEEDFSFLPWVPKVPKKKEFTYAQRWDSFSLDSSFQDPTLPEDNTWEMRAQFMQAFLKHHIKEGLLSVSIEDLKTKLGRQMEEYGEVFDEIHKLDVSDSRRKELLEQVLQRILIEESSTSASSKKRSFIDEDRSLKKVKKDPSDVDVQMQLILDFFV